MYLMYSEIPMNIVSRSYIKYLIIALSFMYLLKTEFVEKILCWGELLFFMRHVGAVLSITEGGGLVYYLT